MPACDKCGRAASLCCSRCTVFYCDVECQRAAWPTHKKVCAKTAATLAAEGISVRARPPRMIVYPRLFFLHTGAASPTMREEVAALTRLALASPWGGRGNALSPFAQLRGSAKTWTEAFESRSTSDPHFREEVKRIDSDDMDTQSAAGADVVGIHWVGLVSMIDPDLCLRVFGTHAPGLCWRCAVQVDPKASSCSSCKRALFCSSECEKAAAWWHKRAEGESGCRR